MRHFLLYPPYQQVDDNEDMSPWTSNFRIDPKLEEQYYEDVERMLEAGVNINEYDLEGCTALHLACTLSTYRMVTLFLKYGANTNSKNGRECLL